MAFDAALKDRDLSFHAHRPAKNKRLVCRMRRITKKITRLGIIGAINNNIMRF